MLDGSRENQQILRQVLLASVPDLVLNGEARKDNYIRRLPDVSGVEITVGVSQTVLDVRLVLKDGAMSFEAKAKPLVKMLAFGLSGEFVPYPPADRRVTLVIRCLNGCPDPVDWVSRGLAGLLYAREQLL